MSWLCIHCTSLLPCAPFMLLHWPTNEALFFMTSETKDEPFKHISRKLVLFRPIWPERLSQTGSLNKIQWHFSSHSSRTKLLKKVFALYHCVSLYPISHWADGHPPRVGAWVSRCRRPFFLFLSPPPLNTTQQPALECFASLSVTVACEAGSRCVKKKKKCHEVIFMNKWNFTWCNMTCSCCRVFATIFPVTRFHCVSSFFFFSRENRMQWNESGRKNI